jgi:hypothetical protein
MKETDMRTLIAVVFAVAATSVVAQEAPKPGKEHELLKQFEGTWTVTHKITMDPSQPPQESKGGTETCTMKCGGLWLVTESDGEMMGMPFHGHGIIGYDTLKKKYPGSWVDNMSTSVWSMEGTYDEAKKAFTYKLTGPDPATGKETSLTMVQTIKDKDSYVMTMSMPGPDGKEAEFMVGTYTRKK